jgi:hypothetical protein
LRRAAVGGGVLLVPASGLSAFTGVASAATPPDADLAWVRILVAAELLALDFHTSALKSGKLRHAATKLLRQIQSDEKDHYTNLAGLMTAAGQTPATIGDIDFSYPSETFRNERSILRQAGRLEHLLLGAYVGAIGDVQTPELRSPVGQIAANEAQHSSGLSALEGRSVIGRAFAQPWPMTDVSDALDRFES